MKTNIFSQIENPNSAAPAKARRNPGFPKINENSNIQVSDATIQPNIVNKPSTSKENTNNKKINSRRVNKKVWSWWDQVKFYTALKLHGKDFVEVSRFMKNHFTRLNQKDGGKSRKEISDYFDQQFNEVKKYIKFPMDIPQYIEELYALINYGVFKTKVKKRLNAKFGRNLNELVNKGITVVKLKEKCVTLRTPICPIFQRINKVNIPGQDYAIPDDVTIELVPRNYVTLWRIQMLELNPRLRMKVALNRLLADVMILINERFKHSFIRMKENLSLPINEKLPTLFLRLVEPTKFFKEVVIRESLKSQFESVTLKAYCKKNLKSKESSLPSSTLRAPYNTSCNSVNTDRPFGNLSSTYLSNARRNNNDNSNNTSATSTSAPITPNVIRIPDSVKRDHINIDFEALEQKLTTRVDLNTSRQIKLLSIFIGLGCPDKIRFEYDYLEPSDYKITGGSHCVHNNLRRLVQLSKNDYMEHIQKTETKGQLDLEIEQLCEKISTLKSELLEMEYKQTKLREPWLLIDKSEENSNKIVYQKQNEVIQQFMDEVPNKIDIDERQLKFETNCSVHHNLSQNMITSDSRVKEPSDNASSLTPQVQSRSLASMKEFNKSRKNMLRVSQKKPTVFVQMRTTRGITNKQATVPNITQVPPPVSVSQPIENYKSDDVPNNLLSNEDSNDSFHSLLNSVYSHAMEQSRNNSSAQQLAQDSVSRISENPNGTLSLDDIIELEDEAGSLLDLNSADQN